MHYGGKRLVSCVRPPVCPCRAYPAVVPCALDCTVEIILTAFCGLVAADVHASQVLKAVFEQKGQSFDNSKRLRVNDARVKVNMSQYNVDQRMALKMRVFGEERSLVRTKHLNKSYLLFAIQEHDIS